MCSHHTKARGRVIRLPRPAPDAVIALREAWAVAQLGWVAGKDIIQIGALIIRFAIQENIIHDAPLIRRLSKISGQTAILSA